MDKLLLLATDVSTLWGKYSSMYFNGIKNTLLLAIIGTVIGCLIGFVCGIFYVSLAWLGKVCRKYRCKAYYLG